MPSLPATVAAALVIARCGAEIFRTAVPSQATDWRSEFFRRNPNISLESLVVILEDDYEFFPDFGIAGEEETLKAVWPGGLLNWPENGDGWPEVPYRYDSDDLERGGIREAIEHWARHTCVQFRDVTDRRVRVFPHLRFQASEDQCSSHFGRKFFMLFGQPVMLAPSCQIEVGVVIHEIGHALGLFHEQNRVDRSSVVQILWKNMDIKTSYNNLPLITENYGVPYDLSSIMHYGPLSFSKAGGSVLVTTDPMAQGLIGMRDVLSHMDKKIVNIQYGCIEKWAEACSVSSDACQHDGYLGADCRCVCPAGTSGDYCQQRDMAYTEALIAKHLPFNAEVTTETTLTSPNYPTPLQDGTRLTTRITAPEGKRVVLKFKDFDLAGRCVRGNSCCFNGLEIRLHGITSGTWYCGREISAGQEFVSTDNALVLFYHSINYETYFLSTTHKGYEATVTFI